MAKGEWKWYLLPGLLGIIGGAIAWVLLRKKDKDFAMGMVYFSITMTIASILVGIIVGAMGLAIGNQILTTLTGGTL